MSAPAVEIKRATIRSADLAWRWPIVTGLVTLSAHLILWHPYWVRGGDSDLYLAVARSIAQGKGFVFNGNPAILIQPFWPAILAGGFDLGFDIGQMKWLTIASIVFYAIIWSSILTRWMPRPAACAIASISALLSPLTTISTQFFTDPPFAALCAGMVLLSLQIIEGRRAGWRYALIALLLALAESIRAACLIWAIVPAIILLGHDRWRSPSRWIFPVFCLVFVVSLHFGINKVMASNAPPIDPRFDTFLCKPYGLVSEFEDDEPLLKTLLTRAILPGQWIATLLIEPVARSGWNIKLLATIAGTTFGGFCAYYMVIRSRKGDWVWLGAAAYGYAICLNWPNVIGRYWLPIAPLVIASGWLGWREVKEIAHRHRAFRFGKALNGLGVIGLAGILLVNLGSFLVEARVARASDPLATHEGGAYVSLLNIANMLRDSDENIAISHYRINRGKKIWTLGHLRAFNLLIDKPIFIPPQAMDHNPDRSMADWMIANKIHYYVYQPDLNIRFHQRGAIFDSSDDDDFDMEWRLYRLDAKKRRLIRMKVVDSPARVTQLPGLS